MLISEYLKLRNDIAVSTGKISQQPSSTTTTKGSTVASPFAEVLKEQLGQTGGVEFSKHALDRIEQRGINLSEGNTLARLDKAVELAQQKGSNDALVLVGSNAFVVSIKNNKVITAMTNEDLQGNVFTNIDSTVIM